ncbi:MAG: beta-lactamase family protein [Bacteroidales bacterium]|nr:beta-lactamase family protein [Bacteroidales bacterium]
MDIDRIVKAAGRRKNIFGATFAVEYLEGTERGYYSCGDFESNQRYYIASINKLIISSLIIRCFHEGRLKPEDLLYPFLPEEFHFGLHFLRGDDYSRKITLKHLLSHTSGLPCYLADKGPDGRRWMSDLMEGIDHVATPWDSLLRASEIEAKFEPGSGKAYYSDTNFQALCIVLEAIEGKPVSVVLNTLFRELGLNDTAVIDETNIDSFVPPRFREEKRTLKQFFTTTGNEIVSTASDQIIFLKAFFNGRLFPENIIDSLTDWKPVFFPFRYGTGIQQFHPPGIMSLMTPVRSLLGHVGSTGCVALYSPEKRVYVAGTVNQVKDPSLSVRLALRIVGRHRLPVESMVSVAGN